jgi:hypothetical protein
MAMNQISHQTIDDGLFLQLNTDHLFVNLAIISFQAEILDLVSLLNAVTATDVLLLVLHVPPRFQLDKAREESQVDANTAYKPDISKLAHR